MLGNDHFRDGASKIYVTGSFWFSAVAMAASLATVDELASGEALTTMVSTGQRLRDGLAVQASSHGLSINQTGPVQMPLLTFAGDADFAKANLWANVSVQHGVYVHPWHNWFLSGAHTNADIDRALVATNEGFAAVADTFGRD